MNKIKINKIVCNICNKVLPNKRSYAGHMRLAHGITVGEKQELKNKIKELTEKYENLQKEYDELEKMYENYFWLEAGICKYCQKPLIWDLADPDDREQVIKIITEGTKNWYHIECKEREETGKV